MHNEKRLLKRIIEKGKRSYSYGLFEAQKFGPRKLTAIIEAPTYAKAAEFMTAAPTESGHSVKGFKKVKARDES